MENENKDVKTPKSDESSKAVEITLKDISTRLGALETLLGSITKKEEKEKEVKNEKLRY